MARHPSIGARSLLLLTCGVFVFTPVVAQVPLVRYGLGPGTVVRLHLESGQHERGKLLAPFAPDSTTFRYCLYPAPVCGPDARYYRERLAAEIRALDLHQGTRAGVGALIGLPVGIAVGIILTEFAESAGERELSGGERTALLLGNSAVFAGIGALIGGTMDRWRPAR
ncbi:MAG: hypothetical protein PVH40_08295 [Gemmatimonadales bacterium]